MPAAETARVVLDIAAVYGVIGALVAVGFLALGVTRIPYPARVTIGARVLLFPAAVVFWPLILRRWIAAPLA